MKTFEAITLHLTPLTPVHIGCGIDFEPTNYVIDDGVLFHFDPSRTVLNDKDRSALLNALGKGGGDALQRVQKFFYDRCQAYASTAHYCVPVATGVATQYRARIGQISQYEANGSRVGNQLEIERTIHHPHSGQPYIPGSSLKGAIRTAWLDQLNNESGKPSERSAQDMEKRLLGGSFQTDPFRLVRLADAPGYQIAGKVYFSTNHKKREVHDKTGQIVSAKGPCARRECIVGGQYRGLTGEIRFDLLPSQPASDKTPALHHQIKDFPTLARACNRFYLRGLEREYKILDSRRLANPDWLLRLSALLQKLKPQLDAGQLMLLRVGRHSGAENVTLNDVRSIKIMTGKGMQPEYSNEGAKTLWLAAENENDRSNLLPFGWLLIEPANAPEHPALKAWCESQPKPDLAAVQTRLAEARASAQAEAQRLQQLANEHAAAEAAAAHAAAEKAAHLAALSTQGRLIAAFADACEARSKIGKDPLNPGNGLYARALGLSREALGEGTAWAEADRLSLATAFENWLPRVIDKLDRKDDWKDARKKLKLAALKGEA